MAARREQPVIEPLDRRLALCAEHAAMLAAMGIDASVQTSDAVLMAELRAANGEDPAASTPPSTTSAAGAEARKRAKEAKAAKAAKARKRNRIAKGSAVTDTAVTSPVSLDWQTRASINNRRDEAGGASVDGKLYVFGGFHDWDWDATTRSDVYDVATNTWTRIADLPEPLTHVASAVRGSTVWLIGGYVGSNPGPAVRSVWLYDTTTNTYSPGPSLPEPRGAGAAALVDDTIVYVGGTDRPEKSWDTQHDKGTTWTLNLDEGNPTWVRQSKMPTNRNHLAAIALRGNVYAIGGQKDDQEQARMLTTVERYNPRLDRWTRVANLPGVTSHLLASTLVYDGQLLTVGGEYQHGYSRAEIYAYDPRADLWSTLAYLPVARRSPVAGLFDGNQLFVTTGSYTFGRQTDETIVATLPNLS